MKHYWCFLCVRFLQPRLVRLGEREEVLRAEGYMRRIGISVKASTDLRNAMRLIVQDGRISWRRSELERIRRFDLGYREHLGVWYRGGPVYFT